jgi:signal transduction histidine kinase
MRHAKATKVAVRLDRLKNELRISISDNGQGMTDKREVDLKSLGIIGMKERIARLDGQFKIFSEPGNGTRLDITIPI